MVNVQVNYVATSGGRVRLRYCAIDPHASAVFVKNCVQNVSCDLHSPENCDYTMFVCSCVLNVEV